jgi:tetratricopeptide (TPR) repeat protein
VTDKSISRIVTVSVVEPHYKLPSTTLRLTTLFLSAFLSSSLVSCDKFFGKNQQPKTALSPLDSISELIKDNPEDSKHYNERAKLYLEKKEYKNAKTDAGKAISLDSSISAYYVTIADGYFFTNEPDKCEASLKKAISLDAQNKEALMKMSEFYMYLNRFEESITFANKILEFDPNFSKAFFIKGMCYKDAGDTARAILNFREAFDKDPESYHACIMLAQLHFGLKDKLAVTYYNNALNLKPKSVEAYYGLAMFYQETGELNRALENYATILSIDANYKNAHYNIGYIHFQYLKNYNEALKHFDNAVKCDASYYQAVYMRGLCYETLGDIQRAKGEYTRALQINPGYQMALDGINRVLK